MDSENQPELNTYPRLPSMPVYMSIMGTIDGKPEGMPVWNSFDNEFERHTMRNESFSSTFISLAKKLADLSDDIDKDGKIMRIHLDGKTYNLFTPHPKDDFQMAFVVVFEEADHVLIEDKYKEELVMLVMKSLRTNEKLSKFLKENLDEQITKDHPLDADIMNTVSKVMIKWDNKRVKYQKKEAIKRRKDILKRIKAEIARYEAEIEALERS